MKKVADLSDTAGVGKRLAQAVQDCRDKSYWVPAVVLVAAGIDRFGGGNKAGYLRLLKSDFPALCLEMAPETFYSKYRNGILHEFSPKKGYALANNDEVDGKYVADVEIVGSGKTLRALNVDRLIADFLALAERRSAGPAKH